MAARTTRKVSKILAGMREAAAYVKGEKIPVRKLSIRVPDEIDVRAIRKRLGLSQDAFAARFGFSAGTVRHWEQHQRRPRGAARILLKVIEMEPEAVRRALGAA
jgi:putative transcriptional regulator